ncbi:SHOCT domain-containing protein [Solirubrobacter sp. CPCC 204708]|uniref:SHOCT domain-containing protein n=1 Tax=Solirubrobacter deserti TaxID=2282478 RepID=A0ABT4RHE3_9ACTN|nr:SHOCT domain-containing protein [Solirubrobacter deserti]MBE2315258.1 SHOCT domain-containing protein [Solirubrobacter deserti]MDA0137942.1 SHOCT domain-containing protein [Solirubrobacter deserti]
MPQDQWPQQGMTLPVTLDRADPTRLKVEWDELPTAQELIQQRTEAMLSGGLPGVTMGQPLVIDLRGQPAQSNGGDQVDRLERLAALHASGVLTDEELAAAKAKLLG